MPFESMSAPRNTHERKKYCCESKNTGKHPSMGAADVCRLHRYLAQRDDPFPIGWTVSGLREDKAAFTVNFLGKIEHAVLTVELAHPQAIIRFYELEEVNPTFKLAATHIRAKLPQAGGATQGHHTHRHPKNYVYLLGASLAYAFNNAISPKGGSGGALIDLGIPDLTQLGPDAPCAAYLAGLFIECYGQPYQQMLFLRIQVILDSIQERFSRRV